MVFHLNGHDGDPEQLKHVVLSEDDYLDQMVRLSTRGDLSLPQDVTEALSKHLLLLLGFDIDDWQFRVLLKGLMAAAERSGTENWYIGVQLEIEDDVDRAAALDYMSRYLDQLAMTVYWGTTRQFVTDLYSRWQELSP